MREKIKLKDFKEKTEKNKKNEKYLTPPSPARNRLMK